MSSANGGPPGPDEYELAACGLFTLDPDGTIRRANGMAARWTGFAREELVGRRFQDLLTVGGRLFHETHWKPLIQMQGSVFEVALEIRHREGHVVPALFNAVRRGDARSPVEVAFVTATERQKYEHELRLARRRAEQRETEFRSLAENSPDLVLRFDRNRRCVYANPAVENLTGQRASALIGKPVDAVAAGQELATSLSRALESALGGADVTEAFSIAVADGKRHELEARVVPEREANGDVATVLAIARDVTALHERERESRQRALFAEQLIGIVSHDLRNPLNAVVLGAKLLEDKLPEGQRRTATRIVSAAQRANRLITDLLDFTQARLAGGLRIERQPIDIHVFVGQCLDEVRLAQPGRKIEHRRTGGRFGNVDPDRISQVISNLVGNALAYGDPERPVTVTTLAEEVVSIEVHNFGPPIPDDVRAHLFEPMRRGHQPQRRARSVGLGLYIVHEIARAHGGSISVRSGDDGTTFRLEVPGT